MIGANVDTIVASTYLDFDLAILVSQLIIPLIGLIPILEHGGEEPAAYVLARRLILQTLEYQQAGDGEEYVGFPAFHLLVEYLVLLGGRLNSETELKQVVALERVQQVVLAQCPCFLKHAQYFN